MSKPAHAKPGGHLGEFVRTSLYLSVCFVALLLYRTSIPGAPAVELVLFGYAVLKAMVLAKFILLAHIFHLGERHRDKPLIYPTLYQTVLLWLLLLALTVVEEACKALWHGEALADAVVRILGGGGVWRVLAEGLLLFLLLLPYVAFRQLGESLGKGHLMRLFFGATR